MEDPPSACYLSLKEHAVKAYAMQNGFAVNRARLKTNKVGTEIRKVWLKYTHARVHKVQGSGLHRTSTMKSNCKRQSVIQRTISARECAYVWNFEVFSGGHSGHNPGEDPATYAINRPEQEVQVAKMTKAGATPRVILSAPRQNESCCLLVGKDV